MSFDKGFEWLQEIFNYVDSITIVDSTGKIMVQQRYNPRFSKEDNERENRFAINKNILEVISSLTPETSTLLRVLKTGKIVFSEKQEMWDHAGRKIVATNINFPIVSRGKVIGAVELSKDVTNIEKGYKTSKYFNIKIPELKTKTHSATFTLNDIISVNPTILKLKEQVKKISNSLSSVLIVGETGTGKELFAQAIHNEGYRKYKPFVAVNCAALPENLLEGILFGTEKGAFTGAENKEGLFEQANGGTIYLDEINSMPLSLQAKLLRVLQEKSIMRLGGKTPTKVDVRVIASINKESIEVIKNGEVREDLFYRLSVINLRISPLRERLSDISILVEHFIKKYNRLLNKEVKGISKGVMDLFMSYRWPGNVRELEHVIEGAMNIVDGNTIELEHLPVYLAEKNITFETNLEPLIEARSLNDAVRQFEKKLILKTLIKTGGNVSKAAKLLELPRTTLQYKIEKYNIQVD